ncbi:MAG TPA: DUF4340 domain-containing protein [Thiothrix sp.]|nr:DUF4340 domain-containing protein [Thiothrix sp.]
MKKQVWLNVFLLMVIVLLIGVLIYLKPSMDVTDQQQGLFKTAIQDVKYIRIERQGQPAMVLVKAKQWVLIKPALAPVNHEQVRHLLTIINEPIQHQLVRKKDDLKIFKLDAERIKLTINDEKITFGMINPVTHNRYVLKNTNIYTIKEIVYGALGSSVTHLLQHHLLPKSMRVTQIEAPSMFYQTKQARDSWSILEATNIADYSADETILGIVSLTIQKSESNNEQNNKVPELITTTLVFDILAIKPTLILGRADLKVKYTIDKMAAKQVFIVE